MTVKKGEKEKVREEIKREREERKTEREQKEGKNVTER